MDASSLPAENRVNTEGQRICRWCSRPLEESTYIPLKKRKRRGALLCRNCDEPRVSWIEEFGDPDGA